MVAFAVVLRTFVEVVFELAHRVDHFAGVKSVLTAVKNAGSVDTDKVIDAMRKLKYDFYKGAQYYRECYHQSVQSVLIVESKSKDMKDKNDVFNIVSVEAAGEARLRTCAELGHKA